MSSETRITCTPHDKPAAECVLCELARQTDAQGQSARIAERVQAVMAEEGLETPPDQFGTLLGLGVTGMAHMEVPLDRVLEAVSVAYAKASSTKPA